MCRRNEKRMRESRGEDRWRESGILHLTRELPPLASRLPLSVSEWDKSPRNQVRLAAGPQRSSRTLDRRGPEDGP